MRGVLARIAKLESRRSTRPIIVVAVGINEDPQLAIDRKLAELGVASEKQRGDHFRYCTTSYGLLLRESIDEPLRPHL
jgi:hypothetical protein